MDQIEENSSGRHCICFEPRAWNTVCYWECYAKVHEAKKWSGCKDFPPADQIQLQWGRAADLERAIQLEPVHGALADQKTLTMTDVGRNMHRASRLVLRRKLVKKHILPYLSYQIINRVENQGAGVTIYDLNTSSEHQLIFKRWKGSGTYVLMSTWSREFVKRRQLKEGDLIGFCWDAHKLMLVFSAIMRAGSQYPSAWRSWEELSSFLLLVSNVILWIKFGMHILENKYSDVHVMDFWIGWGLIFLNFSSQSFNSYPAGLITLLIPWDTCCSSQEHILALVEETRFYHNWEVILVPVFAPWACVIWARLMIWMKL